MARLLEIFLKGQSSLLPNKYLIGGLNDESMGNHIGAEYAIEANNIEGAT